ncbi:nucleotidyl transferase AbiEii/AbiGii toxin family protein, partial [Parafrankia soli]
MTPRRPTRDSLDGRAYLDLQNAARRAGRDTSEYLALYALEGFLTRLSQSRFAHLLVLKGGVLLVAYATRRPTRDIDLQATGLSNEVDEVVALTREIVALRRDDGLVFDPDSITGCDIRDEDPYAGVR